jgi:type I restriction enzyme S subunit
MALGRKPIEIVNDGKHQLLAKAKHWDRIYLKEVAKVQNGYAFSSDNFVKSGGMPLIRIRDIDRNTTVDRFNGKYSDDFIVRKGDLLIGMDGDFKAAIWKGENALLNQRVCRIIHYNKVFDPKFLFLCLQPYLNAINEETSSVTVKHLSSRTIEEIPLPFPPLPEQQAIVAKIEELLSELENGKKQLQTAQQQLKVYRQSLLKWAFEGKLTNKNVKEGELPKGWKWVKNKELLKYVTSGSRDWKQYYSNKGSRFVRTQDINSNKLDLANSAYMDLPEKVEGKRSLIEEGDILMTITGANVGKVAVVDFPIEDAYVSQSVALLKYQDKRITKFLWYFFQAQGFGKSFIDKLVYGVGRPVLSLENMREVDVISCPIEDQKEIIDELESKLTVCDKIEETINQSLLQAETLRQSILKKAFEGKLITTEKREFVNELH